MAEQFRPFFTDGNYRNYPKNERDSGHGTRVLLLPLFGTKEREVDS